MINTGKWIDAQFENISNKYKEARNPGVSFDGNCEVYTILDQPGLHPV